MVLSNNSSGLWQPRRAKKPSILVLICSYFHPASSQSGASQLRNFANAFGVSDHWVFRHPREGVLIVLMVCMYLSTMPRHISLNLIERNVMAVVNALAGQTALRDTTPAGRFMEAWFVCDCEATGANPGLPALKPRVPRIQLSFEARCSEQTCGW
jgi:hypothetical protein